VPVALVALALGTGLLKAAAPAFAAGPAVPVANNDSASTTEDANGVNVNVLANDTDADGDPLTIASGSFGASANGGTVTLVTGTPQQLRYKPSANFNGTDTFTYRATDGANQSSPATVTVTVSAVNDVPDAVTDSKTTAEDTPISFFSSDLTANDSPGPPDEVAAGQTVRVTAVARISGGTPSLNTSSGVIRRTARRR
jgi:VCBS repeat-containing protein